MAVLEKRTQVITIPAAGGYTVPKDDAVRFWEVVLDEELLSAISVFDRATGRNTRNVIEDDTNEAQWVPEDTAATALDSLLAEVELESHKLVAPVTLSHELLQDILAEGQDASEVFRRILAGRVRRSLLRGIVAGTGLNQPTGLFTATLPLATTGVINLANLLALYGGIAKEHRMMGAWLMDDTTFVTIAQLGIPDGLFHCSPEGNFLVGRPIIQSPYAPANAVVFGNLRYYALQKTPQINEGRDSESLALGGLELRFTYVRVDGKPVISASGDIALGSLKPI